MAEISRRDFLIKGSAGAVAVGAFASLPALGRTLDAKEATERTPGLPATTTTSESLADRGSTRSLVAYIPDPEKGEIHYMIGTREIVHKDAALVARMLRDAR